MRDSSISLRISISRLSLQSLLLIKVLNYNFAFEDKFLLMSWYGDPMRDSSISQRISISRLSLQFLLLIEVLSYNFSFEVNFLLMSWYGGQKVIRRLICVYRSLDPRFNCYSLLRSFATTLPSKSIFFWCPDMAAEKWFVDFLAYIDL